jgi:hypothetical protein
VGKGRSTAGRVSRRGEGKSLERMDYALKCYFLMQKFDGDRRLMRRERYSREILKICLFDVARFSEVIALLNVSPVFESQRAFRE